MHVLRLPPRPSQSETRGGASSVFPEALWEFCCRPEFEICWCTHAPDPRLSGWLLQISGVHAPQPVTAQHHDPLRRHSLEASVLGVPRHTALGDGEAPGRLTLPALERKPGPGLREPAQSGRQSGRLPDVGLPAPTGQESLLPPPSSRPGSVMTALPFSPPRDWSLGCWSPGRCSASSEQGCHLSISAARLP